MTAIALPRSILPATRRTWRMFTRPHFVLSSVLLALMVYFVLMPLLIMIQTTITWQPAQIGTLNQSLMSSRQMCSGIVAVIAVCGAVGNGLSNSGNVGGGVRALGGRGLLLSRTRGVVHW